MIESLEKFTDLSQQERKKVIFIHLNHTNQVLDLESSESKLVLDAGFRLGQIRDVFELSNSISHL